MRQPDTGIDTVMWALGTLALSTLLIVGPLLGLLLTPLIPAFALGMLAPFLFRGFALKKFRQSQPGEDHVKRFKIAQTLAMIAGALVGVPIWLAILKAFLNGRYM